MELLIDSEKGLKVKIIKELKEFGCCYRCILRYIGNSEPYIYRENEEELEKILFPLDEVKMERGDDSVGGGNGKRDGNCNGNECDEPAAKILRKSPCVSCLGLLDKDNGSSDAVLDEIAKYVKNSDIQGKSYTINLSLPIATLFRAYFVWCHLEEKFPNVYELITTLKPEGVCLKNAWKWICSARLRDKVDPDSDWTTDGCLTVNVAFKYDENDVECVHLNRLVKISNKKGDISRSNIDGILKDMSAYEFKRKFGDNPPTAKNFLRMDNVNCVHIPLFIAGRYNKYSRKVSQTPWFVDGKRFHEASVEELIADHVLPLMKAKQEKFSASGREDVDVRMLGLGRPFIMEIIQPKRALFTQEDISKLRDRINASTSLIKVRDLQLVDRKASNKLKEGEEHKTKNYCALCVLPGTEITQDIIDKLNNFELPIVLQQKTPVRVLHRRSLATRERSIYSMKAVQGKSKHLFKIFMKTQAGTYVKEFVHGDLGRTKPSVGDILGCKADIVSLDVEEVDFPWPPEIAN